MRMTGLTFKSGPTRPGQGFRVTAWGAGGLAPALRDAARNLRSTFVRCESL